MTLSVFAVEKWLMDTLSADPALSGKTYGRLIPQGTSLTAPLCVFEPVSNVAVIGASGAAHILDNALYRVKVVGQTASVAALKAMAQAVYARLHRTSGSNADGNVWACVYDEDEALPPDLVNGVEYATLSQRYRIYATGA